MKISESLKKDLYLFDFDGTLTFKDSLPLFIRFAVGDLSYFFGLLVLSPTLLGYLLGFISNDKAKEKLIAYHFSGWSQERFFDVARDFSTRKIDGIIRPNAMDFLESVKSEGHDIAVVSASLEAWLSPWCSQQQIKTIGTRLRIENGRISGQFLGANCYGPEKVKRVQSKFRLNDYGQIHAFGDSKGDKELLQLADHPNYRKFH